jgi:hypothetical protein
MKLPKGLEHPVILLGNGINRYKEGDGPGKSWENILVGMGKEESVPESLCLLKNGGVTFPEFVDYLSDRMGTAKPGGRDLYASQRRTYVRQELGKWKCREPHRRLLAFARENHIPILTTNFDTALLDWEDDTIRRRYGGQKKRADEWGGEPSKTRNRDEGFSDTYPLYAYYSDHKIKDALHEFGIWHVHGCLYYKRRLRMSFTNYTNFIVRMKRELNIRSQAREAGQEHLPDSWLDIFMKGDLVIIGLGLESQEIGLRWLLRQRYWYGKGTPWHPQTFYVIDKDRSLKCPADNGKCVQKQEWGKCFDGRYCFFKGLNINVLTHTRQEIYDLWGFE